MIFQVNRVEGNILVLVKGDLKLTELETKTKVLVKGVSRLRFQVNRAEGNFLVLVKGDRQMRSKVN